jgi:hypothetical protein
MHLIFKQHFRITADFVEEPGSILQIKFHLSNITINRLGILYSDHSSYMLDMHIVMRFKVYFSHLGTLVYNLRDLT